MRRFLLLGVFGFACMSFAGAGRAETIAVEHTGISPAYSVNVSYDDDGPGSGAAGVVNTPVGTLNWVPQGGSNNLAPFNAAFQSFCIDLDQRVQSTVAFDVVALDASPVSGGPGAAGSGPGSTLMSALQADYLRELWGEQYASLYSGSATQQKTNATAFQLAIWEILFESASTRDLSGGYFKVAYSGATPGYVTRANEFLASTYDAGFSAYQTGLVALVSAPGQDQIALVPLPPAALAGIALIGSIAAARKARGYA